MDIVYDTWRTVSSLEDVAGGEGYALRFAAVTLVVAFFAVLLDLCYRVNTGESFLRIRHGWSTTPVFFLAWPIGSAVFSWFGLALSVIQPTMFGAAAAAIAWTLFVKRAVESLAEKRDVDESED